MGDNEMDLDDILGAGTGAPQVINTQTSAGSQNSVSFANVVSVAPQRVLQQDNNGFGFQDVDTDNDSTGPDHQKEQTPYVHHACTEPHVYAPIVPHAAPAARLPARCTRLARVCARARVLLAASPPRKEHLRHYSR